MPYEIFDNSKGCNPLLPLNDVSNIIYLYKVNVFEKEFDLIKYAPDGEIPSQYVNNSGIFNPKLGLPLAYVFPHLKHLLKPIHINPKGGSIRPSLVGIENIFSTSGKGDIDPPREMELVTIDKASIKKGFINLNGKKVDLSKIKERLNKFEKIILKIDGKAFKLEAEPDVASYTVKKSNKSIVLSASSFPNLDPSVMEDELYFEIYAALLFDRRSGFNSGGKQSDFFNPSKLSDEQFQTLLAVYKRDPRSTRLTESFDVVVGGKLPGYEIGLVTAYEQNWDLKGYSRGALINSITLAPQEELTIEIFTYDRFKIEEEKQMTTEFEKNIESSSLSRVSSQIARDLSETTNSSAGLGLGVTLPIEGVPVNIDANGDVNSTVKSGITSTLNNINETTIKASERVKSTTQIKISQTHEFGNEKRTTRKIKNHNGSRTLTLNYFEVVETYDVKTKIEDGKKFCLLVDNPDLGPVGLDFVLSYEDRIQRALLSSNFKPGFEAAKKLAAQRWFEKRSEIKTEIDNNSKQNGGTNTSDPEMPQKPIVRITLSLRQKLAEFTKLDLMSSIGVLKRHYDPFESNKPAKKEVSKAEDSLGLFNFWLKYKMGSPGIETKALEFLDAVSAVSPSEQKCVAELEKLLSGMDDEWLTAIKMTAMNLVLVQLTSLCAIPAPILIPVLAELALISNDNGLPAMVEKAKKELKNYDIASLVPTTVAENVSVATPQIQPPPPQIFSLGELALANAEFEKLSLHIEANKTYYQNQIWLYEDSGARYERLKAKGLSRFVENRILCFVGNKSALPLNLSSIQPELKDDLEKNYSNFTIAANEVEVLSTVTIPTSGMYVDSVLGACESLEPYLLERREIEKQLAKAQADSASARVKQMELEAKRLEQRISKGDLANPNI